MRRIVMFNRVSVDGYFADADGGLNWAVPDAELDAEAQKGSTGNDAMLFGRVTYELFEAFWPTAGDEDPHAKGRKSPAIQAMAKFINENAKLVFTRTRSELPWQNSQSLGEFSPSKVRALKEQPGKNIILFGSGSIVSLLSEHGLIDEYRFIVSPLLLGEGDNMIRGVPRSVPLELLSVKRYESGNLALGYAPKAR
jgi:dihydrofolate reductase